MECPKQLLYHAIEIQPIRIQESHWILEGIQPNLLTGDLKGIES